MRGGLGGPVTSPGINVLSSELVDSPKDSSLSKYSDSDSVGYLGLSADEKQKLLQYVLKVYNHKSIPLKHQTYNQEGGIDETNMLNFVCLPPLNVT